MQGISSYPYSPYDLISRVSQETRFFPREADAVVIGGGIVGVTSAYYLRKQGLNVVLIEKDRIASQQSGRNWGFVRTQYRDPAELPLSKLALSIWPSLEKELGVDIGWRQNGCIFVAEDKEECGRFENWYSLAKDIASDARMLTPQAASKYVPDLNYKITGALYTHSDGAAEPGVATNAFASAAEKGGAHIIEDCGALTIETKGGVVSGVVTEHGLIKCGIVICAAGATTHKLLSNIKLKLPQQIVRNTVTLTKPLSSIISSCFCGIGLGMRQRNDGSCILSSETTVDIDLTLDTLRDMRLFMPGLIANWKTFSFKFGSPFLEDLYRRFTIEKNEEAVVPRRPRIIPNAKRAVETVKLFQNLFKITEEIPVVKSWAGYIDALPDAIPVIDNPPSIPGLIVATGFSGHGFGIGPGAGAVVAELAAGRPASVDLKPFRLERFTTGDFNPPFAPL